MTEFIKKYHWHIFIAIILLAAVLRFYDLSLVDLTTDDALYSFRALGWFDYLGSNAQTTPIQWFEQIPAWANLSFHDGPPLAMAIQKIFFTLFGDNTFAAKIPFALAGVGLVVIIYLIIAELRSKSAGLLGAGLAAIFSFNIWISRVGYLEGIEIFFISLAFYFFLKYLNTKKAYFLLFWAAALGLTLIVKYTSIYIIPAFILYILIYDRKIFKLKEFYFSLGLILLIISPVAFYNLKVYQTRSHFDAALSSIVGMHPQDFSIIAGRSLSHDYWNNFLSVAKILESITSWPLILIFLCSLIYLIWSLVKRRKLEVPENLIIFGLFFLLVLFIFTGASLRFFPLINPFIIIIITIAAYDFLVSNAIKSSKIRGVAIILLIFIFGWEFLYSINSNILASPINENFLIYSSTATSANLGFSQMEKYLLKNVLPANRQLIRPATLNQVYNRIDEYINTKHVVYFYDCSTSWFAYMWYEFRYPIYYGLPVICLDQMFQNNQKADPITLLRSSGIRDFYFIYGVNRSVLDPVKADTDIRKLSESLSAELEKNNIIPAEIKNRLGQTAFKVYHFN